MIARQQQRKLTLTKLKLKDSKKANKQEADNKRKLKTMTAKGDSKHEQ